MRFQAGAMVGQGFRYENQKSQARRFCTTIPPRVLARDNSVAAQRRQRAALAPRLTDKRHRRWSDGLRCRPMPKPRIIAATVTLRWAELALIRP